MEFIEISAKTVDDAITKASIEMGTSSDNLEIQVVSEGSSGLFFGIGSKPAIIKVRKKETKAAETEVKTDSQPEKKFEKKPEQKYEKNNDRNHDKKPEKKAKKPVSTEKHSVPERKEYVVVERTEEEIASMKEAASKFLKDVFRTMELSVEIHADYKKETGNLEIDFSGDDMGMLIGKRGQTLDSLQYLTSLVVNKGQEQYIRVKLDTENYRSRRKDTLENLARNIAYKVRRTRKPVSLEPMNPYERRIIHSALQGNRYVETYSEGSEPYRHVVVTLKK